MTNRVNDSETYIYCTDKEWSLTEFLNVRSTLPGQWTICTTTGDLELALKHLNPAYIFFPHWSSIVPKNITEKFNCVCFHMTDLPYGRGGSPLQNLILKGHEETKLTALKMTRELDAGPVYLKESLSLHGTAFEIYTRMSMLAMQMILQIVAVRMHPKDQAGEISSFRRRKPNESQLPTEENLTGIYDFIRMLDAPAYPKAFMVAGELHFEFSNAEFLGSELMAKVKISKFEGDL